MNRRTETAVLLPLISLFCSTVLVSMPTLLPDTTRQRPTMEAIRVTNPIVVDGKLSEAEWQGPGITDFTQRDPDEGARSALAHRRVVERRSDRSASALAGARERDEHRPLAVRLIFGHDLDARMGVGCGARQHGLGLRLVEHHFLVLFLGRGGSE